MRPVADSEPSPSSKRRLPLLIFVGLLFVALIAASGIASTYTDYLWFEQLGISSVWTKILTTKGLLAVSFSLIFFGILFSNLMLAERLKPTIRPPSPEEDLIERYHAVIGQHGRKLWLGISGFFGLVFGLNISAEWRTWLLFRNGGDFGRVDPLHGMDAGFYVFRLPFWTFLVDWVFVALAFALLASVVAHYLNGSIRAIGSPNTKGNRGVKLHLSILLAIIAVVRAVAYHLDKFELVNNDRGLFDGALATDVEVQLPALKLLVLISLTGAALFIANIWRDGWGLPIVAVALWAVSHIVVGSLFPALYQRLAIEPEQSSRERQYIGSNIEATRFAYGLGDDKLTIAEFDNYNDSLTLATVEANPEVFDNVRLVDPDLAAQPFTKDQGERRFYEFVDLDVDRYQLDGEVQPVVLSVRGLNSDEVDSGWENQHVAFTHGYGAAVAAANNVGDGGSPDYLVSGIGPTLRADEGFGAELTQPRVYFGEDLGGYAIVGASGRNEVDFPVRTTAASAGEGEFRYDGEGGVGIGSFVRQLAFALRFQQLDPLISPFVGGDSRVIYNRDVISRVRTAAPFLELDADPYPVITDGRIKWIVDGYTTTNRYPYSQRTTDSRSLPSSSDLDRGYNYVRDSVKIVVDAYDGSITMYIIDPDDPIAAAYAKAFPDLFTDEAPPAELREHFRYPQDLFDIQTDVWGRYQVGDAVQFLQGELAWTVATQPQSLASGTGNGAGGSRPMESQYVVTKLPDQQNTEFVLQRAFVPSSGAGESARPELTALLVARSDPEYYGQLLQYPLPDGVVAAPDLVDSEIKKEGEISTFITPLDLQGSTVQFGAMIMVLVEDTMVYIRPLYVEANTETAVPELNQVIAVSGNRIAMAPTLAEVIREVTIDGDTAPPSQPDPPPDTRPPPEFDDGDLEGRSLVELVGLVDDLLEIAERAEANGDAETAADTRGQARAVVARIDELLNGS